MLWIKHNIVEAVAEYFTDTTGGTDAMLLIRVTFSSTWER
jgi:hypothetical protein